MDHHSGASVCFLEPTHQQFLTERCQELEVQTRKLEDRLIRAASWIKSVQLKAEVDENVAD